MKGKGLIVEAILRHPNLTSRVTDRIDHALRAADRTHRQFAGKLSIARSARLVRQGYGTTGSNLDYLKNTLAHLRELKMRDETLEKLARRVGAS